MIALGPVSAALGRVPIWAWALAAVLAWGTWNRHQARSVRAEFEQAKVAAAAERAASAVEAAAESLRRRREQQEATDAANLKTAQLERSVAASADAGQRLRARLAAVQAERCARDPAAAASGPAAAAAADLSADVHRRLDEVLRGVARYADAAAIAGTACEQSYRSLSAQE